MDNSLVNGWNELLSLIESAVPGLFTVLAVIGAAIAVIAIIKWAWQKRKGQLAGIGGFPWMAVVFGLLLAAPKWIIPIVLQLLQVVIVAVTKLIDWGTKTLG